MVFSNSYSIPLILIVMGFLNPLQYSCLGNPMNRGASQGIVHGATKNWT